MHKHPMDQDAFPSHLILLELLINLLLQYKEHLAKLDKSIEALAEELLEYDLIQSIPGIGTKIAATILAEIGEIDRFDHEKKLVAFAGIDPSVFSSGKFVTKGSQQYLYKLNDEYNQHKIRQGFRILQKNL